MGLAMLVGVIPLIILVFVVVGLVASKKLSGEHAEGGNELIKTVYVYLVLFATLMMSIGGTVAAFMAVADLVSPASYYQSFADYQRENLIKQDQKLSETDLKNRYDLMVAAEKLRIKDRAVNSLIKSFGWILIPLPVFVYFQRKVKNQTI